MIVAHEGFCLDLLIFIAIWKGVGVGKKRYLRKELGDGTVKLMQDIKDLIDPNGIMNPGKLYPDMDVEP